MRSPSLIAFVLAGGVALAALPACGGNAPLAPPAPMPSPLTAPDGSTQVVPGGATGATQITFVSAQPPPGSTLPRPVEMVFDQPDDVCVPPLTIATMDAGVEGSVEIASRQEWAVRSFLP